MTYGVSRSSEAYFVSDDHCKKYIRLQATQHHGAPLSHNVDVFDLVLSTFYGINIYWYLESTLTVLQI